LLQRFLLHFPFYSTPPQKISFILTSFFAGILFILFLCTWQIFVAYLLLLAFERLSVFNLDIDTTCMNLLFVCSVDKAVMIPRNYSKQQVNMTYRHDLDRSHVVDEKMKRKKKSKTFTLESLDRTVALLSDS